MKVYRLRKSLHIFRHALKLYRRKKKDLSDQARSELVSSLNLLQEKLIEKDRAQATEKAHEVGRLVTLHLKKTPFERVRDFIVGLGLALLVAVLIRTLWFELYEIPTGSMRPTLAEGDRLVVSKTTFGINVPLRRGHFYFDPQLALRNGVVVFTGAGMDIRDVDMLYFYLFPGKKQFVKRLIGKPGDVLYFYGGQIYGIDKDGKDITDDLNPDDLSHIDHVPFIHFNGRIELPKKATAGIYSPITLKQMNLPVAQLCLSSQGRISGTLLSPFKEKVRDYYDLWGFEDYGISRLLTAEEVSRFTNIPVTQLGEAPLYMEVVHHPTVKYPKLDRSPFGQLLPSVGTTSSVIPLTEEHLQTLMANLYTARFIVKEGKAARYGSQLKAGKHCTMCPTLSGVPDGTYEFYYGQGYKVLFGGILKKLPKDHPLYQFSPERVQLLYNLGIEFSNNYAPQSKEQYLLPSRYIYYRCGDLYAMGAPLMKKDDPTLIKFIQQEYLRQEAAPSYRPHIPFDDPGPPLTRENTLDIALIQEKGIAIPPLSYMALGDNYAMSGDSRDFGWVPEENLRGAPNFIFWPPGPRIGGVVHSDYPFFNTPRLVIWLAALIGFGTYTVVQRKRYDPPQKIE